MANVWIRKGKPQQTQPQESSMPQESYLDQAKRIGTATGLKGLEGLQSLFTTLPELLLGHRPSIPQEIPGQQPQMVPLQYPTEIIQQQAGLTPEYLEARNAPERYLQRFATNALPALLSGGLGAVGRTAVGSGVGSLLGEANLPESVQDIGQLATEIGLGLGTGRHPTVRAAQKTEDTLMRAAVKPGSKANAGTIIDALSNVEKELSTEVSEKYSNKIKHVLRTVGENITKNEIEPNVAVDLRKKLYNLGKELPDKISTTYLNPITKSLNDFFAAYAAENPKFYDHLKARDKLTSFKHMNTILPQIVDKLNLNKLPGGQLATDLVNYMTSNTEKFFRGIFGKNSQARKYYFDIFSAAIKDNPGLVIKNAQKLAKTTPDFNEQKINEPKNVWIRKGKQ